MPRDSFSYVIDRRFFCRPRSNVDDQQCMTFYSLTYPTAQRVCLLGWFGRPFSLCFPIGWSIRNWDLPGEETEIPTGSDNLNKSKIDQTSSNKRATRYFSPMVVSWWCRRENRSDRENNESVAFDRCRRSVDWCSSHRSVVAWLWRRDQPG